MAKKLKTGLGVCQVPPSRTYGPWGTSKLLALRVNFTLTCTTLAARQVACLQGLTANCLRYNIEYRLAIATRSTHHQNDAAGLPQRQSTVENPVRRKEEIG